MKCPLSGIIKNFDIVKFVVLTTSVKVTSSYHLLIEKAKLWGL